MGHKIENFRTALYEILPSRKDTVMDLLDALASNTTARSVVELSLSPFFRRQYSSVSDGIANLISEDETAKEREAREGLEKELLGVIVPQLPPEVDRKFKLFGLDVTPQPRPHARTLADRTYVYQPNQIKGNKPVTVGHQVSLLAYLPEKGEKSASWLVPLSLRRVHSEQKKNEVGAEQVRDILTSPDSPFQGELKVLVGDADYSDKDFLGAVLCQTRAEGEADEAQEIVLVVRGRGNRTLYHQPQAPDEDEPSGPGHPQWYGPPMRLQDEETWSEPDQTAQTTWTTHRDQVYTVHFQAWHNLLMRGSRTYPLHRHPFTLIRATVVDQAGQAVFSRPLWLIVIGSRRAEINLIEAWQAYGQRVDLEHFFRFGKQRLLFNDYQTPEVSHAENWLIFVQLAYIFLFLAAEVVADEPRPWEKPAPKDQAGGTVPPTRAQRGFGTIISQFGTPAQGPKRRGYSPGRASGFKPPPRPRRPVIKKGKKTSKLPLAV